MTGTVRWFGAPWPQPDYRAPVCEDDSLRIPVPIRNSCAHCNEPILSTDQGIRLAGIVEPWWSFYHGIVEPWWSFYHARCFLAEVIGEPMAEQIWEEALR